MEPLPSLPEPPGSHSLPESPGSPGSPGSPSLPESLRRAAALVEPALRDAVDRLADRHMRRVAGYQLGWWDPDGTPTDGHAGKRIRGALAVVGAEAAGCASAAAVPGAAAVELIHNFSLLHDDVMDRDVERRHRPTGWVAFGEPAAVLGGTALLTLAVELLAESAPAALPCLLTAIQQLISGQSDDLLLESAPDAQLAEVLRMAAGKTGALLSCAAAVGAVAAGAPARPVTALADYGRDLGMAFQLVDDILGIDGDPAATGKSASSDVRAGKRSAPIVAALQSGTEAATRLRKLLADGPPSRDADVAQAADLVHEAGGIAWARRAATGYAARACGHLDAAALRPGPAADLVALAHFVLARDR